MIEIVYNNTDQFDEQHYPIQDWHREVLAQIVERFKLDPTKKWYYQATLCSRTFSFLLADLGPQHSLFNRFSVEDLQFFAGLKGFRWIEYVNGHFGFSLTHNEPQA